MTQLPVAEVAKTLGERQLELVDEPGNTLKGRSKRSNRPRIGRMRWNACLPDTPGRLTFAAMASLANSTGVLRPISPSLFFAGI